MRDHARVRFDDQACIALLLTGDDVVNNHRATGRDRFLHSCSSGFSDEQMALVKHTRKLLRPTDNFRLATTCRFDRLPESTGAADGHCETDAKTGKSLHQFRCARRGGMDHVQNAALRIVGRHVSVLRKVSKFWAYRKSECFDLLWCDSRCLQHCGTRFVWN